MPFDETLVDKGSFFYWVPEGQSVPPVGDGVNYSRALGWQSPEGNFYGQERWVRDWHSAVIWTGTDYEILEADGHANSVSELPIPGEINPRTGDVYGSRVPFEIWTVPRPNWPPADMQVYDGRLLDYYWWNVDTQAWQIAEWFFLCEGEDDLPRPGIKLGACHVIVYYDVKVMWNGYYWKRYSLEMIDGGERVDELEGLTELTSGQVTTLQGDHNELLESFFGYQTEVAQELVNSTQYVTNVDRKLEAYIRSFIEDINSFSADNIMTQSEADELKLKLNQINSESDDVIAVATEFGVVAEKAAYIAALDILEAEIDVWIDKTYPLTIAAQDKSDIIFCANELLDRFIELHAALLLEYDGNIVDYVDGQIDDVDDAIGLINDDIAEFSSDGFITFVESKALKISWIQLESESTDIIAIATGLGIITQKNDYIIALATLEDELALWVDLPEEDYPIVVESGERAAIELALENVSRTKSILIKEFDDENREYVNEQVSQLDGLITNLETNVDIWLSDEVITELESETLTVALDQLTAESNDVIAIASGLEPPGEDWAEKLAYIEALSDLIDLLDNYIDIDPVAPATTAYPITVTALQRGAINTAFALVKSTQAALTKKIQAANVDYIDGEISELDGRLLSLSGNLDLWLSDEVITELESETLTVALDQLTAESNDVIAIASSLEETGVDWVEKLAYIEALSDLIDLLDNYIDVAPVAPALTAYPITVTVEARTAISLAFAEVQSTKSVLVNKIAAVRQANAESNSNSYTTGQIEDVNEALVVIRDDILEFSDDGFITFTESINLKLSLAALNKESLDLIAVATSLGVIVEKNNYSTALTNLSNAIAPWVGLAKSAYPKVISSAQRADLILRLETVENTKSLLVNEVIRKRQEDVAKYVNNQISDANSSLTALYNEWTNRVSDDSITYAEAASLRLVMSQFLYEVDALKAIADGVGEDALALVYKNAALALTSGIGALINDTYTYPVAISSAQKAAIEALFETARSTKKALIDALTVTATYGIGGIGFDVSQFRLVFNGLIRGFTPELKLVFVSSNELSLQPNYTDYSYLTVNDQNIQASARTSVYTQTPVLAWTEATQTFTQSALTVDTPYWVYLANRSDCFNIESGSTPYDYRGRLFCSGTEPSNNYLGESDNGLNAVLVGRAQTHGSELQFLHEYGVSYISRTSDLKETFREYSDFDLIFVDLDTLRLQQNYGSYGQIYIPEGVYYIGDDREVYTTSARLELNVDGSLNFDYSTIADNETYYVYIAGDVDLYNDNDVNTATGRPWHPEDSDPSPSLYDVDKDLRLYLFLSTQVPDNGRLSETYNGYWTRWVGIIQTDDNGKFKYSKNLSVIRQPTLNHADIEDIASISIVTNSESSFKIVKKPGTNGAVYVGGIPVYVEDADHTLAGHTLSITSQTKTYTEASPTSPLSDSGTVVNTIVNSNIYVYLANSRTLWGSTANSLFFSTLAPTGGYLSNNWPGNQCRWLCTLSLAPATYSAELITNPTFSTNASWTFGTGWTYDSDDKKAAHTTPSATGTLSQSITVTAGSKYEFIASIRDRNVGGVSVSLGGTQGQVLWANMSVSQYIVAADTNGLILTPNEEFDGSIDNIYCKKVLTGKLTGSYVVDSVGFGAATLNDTVISYNEGWSSAKIMEELNKLATQFGLSNESQDQANSGLPLILEYYSSTQLKLKCVNELPVTVVFPDLTSIEINSEGFVGTVTGDTETLYYVYIDKDSATDAPNGLIVSETEPDAVYPSKQTLGDTKILVGYVGFSATDTLAGAWNVYSFWNQSTQEWTKSITNCSSFYFDTMNGFVVPPDISAVVSRTGTTKVWGAAYSTYVYVETATSGAVSNSITWDADYLGLGSITYYVQVSVTVSLTHSSFATGVFNISSEGLYVSNISVSGTQGGVTMPSYLLSSGCSYGTGAVTLTRPGNIT